MIFIQEKSVHRSAPWIIILTHGNWGEKLAKSAETIVGTLKNVYSFALLPEMSLEDYLNEIKKVLENAPDGSLILTDLLGSTTSNIAAILSKTYKISAISGLSMSMLIYADEMRKTYCGEELANALVLKTRQECENIIEVVKSKNEG